MSERYLVVTAVGTDRPGIVAEFTAPLARRGVNVADSRMAALGGEFALMMLLHGNPDDLEAARRELEPVAERLGLQLLVKETEAPTARRTGSLRPYEIRVHALDHPGIVHAVTDALRRLGGNIVTLDTAAYQASVTGAPLFRMTLTADFPAETTAARIRDALEQVSEAANADFEVHPL